MDALKVSDDNLVDLMFHLKWNSGSTQHADVYNAAGVNIWRDYLPPEVLQAIKNRNTGDRVDIDIKPENLFPATDKRNLFDIKRNQFGNRWPPDGHEARRYIIKDKRRLK